MICRSTVTGIILAIMFTSAVYAELSADEARLAKKHFNRGLAAVEIAQDTNDYQDAVDEFAKAVRIDPTWGAALYNLALVQEKTGAYYDAMANLRTALASAATAEETDEIQSLIDKIEYKIEKQNEPVAAVAVAAVEEDARPIVIPELGARLDYLKFYGADQKNVPQADITYSKYFKRQNTSYVYGEIGLSHAAKWSRFDFSLEVVYIKPNGNVMGRYDQKTYVEDYWVDSYHSFSWGWQTTGYWEVGRYAVEVYYKGNLIATEEFTVY